MPAVTTVGDKSTGHDTCPPVEAVEGASNFLVNGKPLVLVGDKYASHSCQIHTPHQGNLTEGSPSFTVNGRAVGRVGDKISCGGTVAEGKSFFIIGNGNNEKVLNKAICRRNEAVSRYKRRREDDIFFCLPLIAEHIGNNEFLEKDRQGWFYLRDMFYKWLCGEADTDAKANPSPFWVDMDWVLSYPLAYDWENKFPDWVTKQEAINQLSAILAREGYLTKQDCEFDFINTPWQEWEKLYYQRFNVTYQDTGLLTGLYACLGSFTFRFLPKGKIEYVGANQYKITIEQVAGFVHDSFNFDGENQLLGNWSCENKDVSSIPGVFDKTYIYMDNAKFMDFREHNKLGNDFLVLSKPKLIDNFNIYPYNFIYE